MNILPYENELNKYRLKMRLTRKPKLLVNKVSENKMEATIYIPHKYDSYTERQSISGMGQRQNTRLFILPETSSQFDVCHLIPFKYVNTENDSRLLFGGSRKINNQMSPMEDELRNALNNRKDCIYNVVLSLDSDSYIKIEMTLYEINPTNRKDIIKKQEIIQDQMMKYKFEMTPEESTKDIKNERKKQPFSSSNSFESQWNKYASNYQLIDGTKINGVILNEKTIFDRTMNIHHYPNEEISIIDKIDGINWIYSSFVLYKSNLNDTIKGYISKKNESMSLHVVSYLKNINDLSEIQNKIRSSSKVIGLSDVSFIDEFTYELHLAHHSRLYENSWELKEGESAELDPETMTVYPMENERGIKRGITFKNKPGTIVYGVPGSGKTASIRTLIVPFILSKYSQVEIVNLKQSNDYSVFKYKADMVMDQSSGINIKENTTAYLMMLKNEMLKRNQILKEMGENNFWDIPVDKRPFPFKLVVIDEFHTLFNGNYNFTLLESSRYTHWRVADDLISHVLKTCRSTGIHMIFINQNISYEDGMDDNTSNLIDIYIGFRSNISSGRSNPLIKQLKILSCNIPNTIKSMGVSAIQSEDMTELTKFGYYQNDTLNNMMEKIPDNLDYFEMINSIEYKNKNSIKENSIEIENNTLFEHFKKKTPISGEYFGIDYLPYENNKDEKRTRNNYSFENNTYEETLEIAEDNFKEIPITAARPVRRSRASARVKPKRINDENKPPKRVSVDTSKYAERMKPKLRTRKADIDTLTKNDENKTKKPLTVSDYFESHQRNI